MPIKNTFIKGPDGIVRINVRHRGEVVQLLVDDYGFSVLNDIGGAVSARVCTGKLYFTIRKEGKNQYVHRLITDCPHGKVVDHINRDTTDNRCENLRTVSKSENMFNIDGVRGIDCPEHTNKFRARIFVRGKEHHLGYFETFEDAYAARLDAEELFIHQTEVVEDYACAA